MKKESILIVHNYYQIPGGEDTVVENEKRMLEDNGHKVFLYTRHNNEIKKRNILGKLILPFEAIYSFKTIKDIKKIIRENDIDIVHIHNTLHLISPSVYKAAKDCGVKVIKTLHNYRLVCPSATLIRDGKVCKKCLESGLYNAIKYSCYRNSKLQSIITTSIIKFNRIIGSYKKIDKYILLTGFGEDIFKNFIGKNKICIKPNFCGSILKDSSEISYERKNYFVYFGRIDKLKGIDKLVNAWKKINNSTLLIIGVGPYEQELKEDILNNNINNIKYLGYKNRDEIRKIISNSYAVIVPSQWYEPFGMVVIEAFGMGTTVIASNIGALGKIVKNNYNGLIFDYNNEQELITCINYLINNETERIRLNKNAFQSYLDNYTLDINYRMLLDIYRQ
ncbi:glycosyltransferase family 4 protein [Clostridium perfringens]|uniref:glycosyltransferase family 4 protein n=2 Tax=Clostridium perfringens TaxID=1502 RepID=UPI002906C811|nr:glycosyltransferase family 4 protein [Clostridium perfringens]